MLKSLVFSIIFQNTLSNKDFKQNFNLKLFQNQRFSKEQRLLLKLFLLRSCFHQIKTLFFDY